MRHFLILLIILFLLPELPAQHLGAYSDFRGKFYIFDHGKHTLVEDLEVQDFMIGGNCVIYQNNLNHLKLYQDGQVSTLEKASANKIYATDYLIAYAIQNKLKVLQEGKPLTLSYRTPVYEVQDSLIVFFDENKASLRVYYKDSIVDIENGVLGLPVSHLKSGDNLVAYISSDTKDFKVFYRGELQTLLRHVEGLTFKAGRDIIAYVDRLDNSFNAFYKGEIINLETFSPISYRMGDGFVAYVDDMGNFKVFYDGDIIELSSYAPDSYVCRDNLLFYSEYDYISVFHKGEIYEVESFIPRNFEMDWNTIVYLDPTNRLWMFSEGEKQYLVNDVVEGFKVYRDLVVLNLGMNRNLIFYQGKMYEGESY